MHTNSKGHKQVSMYMGRMFQMKIGAHEAAELVHPANVLRAGKGVTGALSRYGMSEELPNRSRSRAFKDTLPSATGHPMHGPIQNILCLSFSKSKCTKHCLQVQFILLYAGDSKCENQ